MEPDTISGSATSTFLLLLLPICPAAFHGFPPTLLSFQKRRVEKSLILPLFLPYLRAAEAVLNDLFLPPVPPIPARNLHFHRSIHILRQQAGGAINPTPPSEDRRGHPTARSCPVGQ